MREVRPTWAEATTSVGNNWANVEATSVDEGELKDWSGMSA